MKKEVNDYQCLLPKPKSNCLKRRFFITRKFITSCAALVILLSSYPVTLMSMMLLYPRTYKYFSITYNLPYASLICGFLEALVFCFYPLAGYLADIKIGRYKMVLGSLIVLSLGLLIVMVGAIGVTFVRYYVLGTSGFIISLTLSVMILLTGVLLLIGSFIGFKANVIQYGLDQSYDSPSEEQGLYVHWYVWTCYVALLTKNLVVSPIAFQDKLTPLFYSFLTITYLVAMAITVSTLLYIYRNKRWFYIDKMRHNPYTLVFKVSQFAYKHKVPIQRSAFTFCEDNLPSGLDLGKLKYGGPFSTEQVEDVKAFYGMLKIILCLGPVFFLNSASNPSLSLSSSYLKTSNQTGNTTTHSLSEAVNLALFGGNILYPLFIVICIPIHIILIRPFLFYVTPGMLKRIGLGVILCILSLAHTFVINSLSHSENKALGCIFNTSSQHQSGPNLFTIETKAQYIKTLFMYCQSILLGSSKMLIYISIYEFICSQSPHSMKGLLIGIVFAIDGTCTFLGSVAVLPFSLGWPSSPTFPSCGMTYYAIHITLGLLGLALYSCVAKQYKYRIRDEPCQVRQYVEDYYSNLQKQRLAHGSDSFKM